MGTLTIVENITLDGVMQGPARVGEDTSDGFAHSGWAMDFNSPEAMQVAQRGMARPGSMLFGRRTYEDFYDVWPKRTDNPFTPVLNAARKFVVSTTLGEDLPWENSVLLRSLDEVAALKASEDLVVLGSGELARGLHAAGLIDRYQLSIVPIVLGSGTTLFGPGERADLHLIETVPTSTGVIIATYTS